MIDHRENVLTHKISCRHFDCFRQTLDDLEWPKPSFSAAIPFAWYREMACKAASFSATHFSFPDEKGRLHDLGGSENVLFEAREKNWVLGLVW